MSFDTFLFTTVHTLAGTSGFLDVLFVFLAKYLAVILFVVACIFIFRQKKLKNRLYVLSFISLTALMSRGFFTEVIRFFYDRPRPSVVLAFTPFFNETTSSFPSGHAAFLFALACAVWYFNRKWGTWLFAGACINGIARVVAGMHWPTDILGGIFVSIISVFIVHMLISSYAPLATKKPELEKEG